MAKEKSFLNFLKNHVFNPENMGVVIAKTRFIEVIRTSATNAYPFEGLDLANKTFNGKKITQNNKSFSYQSRHFAPRIFAFLGLSNTIDDKSIKTTFYSSGSVSAWDWFKQILKSLSGWSDQQLLLFNIPRAIVLFPIKVILILPKIALNTLKLATEFLPYLLSLSTLVGIAKLNAVLKSEKSVLIEKILAVITIAVLFILHFAFKLIHLVGRSITSPWLSIKTAFKAGQDIGGIAGDLVSALLVAVSALITLAAYLIALPLALKFIATQIPAAATASVNFLAPYLAPIGNVLGPFFAPLFTSIGITTGTTLTTASMSLASITTALTVLSVPFKALASKINTALDEVSEKWRKAVSAAEETVSDGEDLKTLSSTKATNNFHRESTPVSPNSAYGHEVLHKTNPNRADNGGKQRTDDETATLRIEQP